MAITLASSLKLVRWEGLILLVAYFGFIGWLFA